MPVARETGLDLRGEIGRVEGAIERATQQLAKSIQAADRERLRMACFTLFVELVFVEAIKGGHEGQSLAFEPILRLAREIRGTLPASPATEAILGLLRDAAASAVGSGVFERHDFLGRIYHKLLLRTTGSSYAAYYTSLPAARLLAQLTFTRPITLESLEGFRVLDPACGSGTLLSAAYTALKDAYVQSQPTTADVYAFHRRCIEEVLHGWDVLDFAAHLTLSTLALHEVRAEIARANICTLPTGISPTGSVHLGALDLLNGGGVDVPSCDVVMMNPPFSRSANPGVKFGYSDVPTKARMDARLRRVGRALGIAGIGHAGLAAYFVLLGDRLLKEGGRLALVLPRSCLSGVSWSGIRSLIVGRYQLEYVISNYDPGDARAGVEPWNWSESTDLGEVMLIARRVDAGAVRGPVCYVSLWCKPRSDGESAQLGEQIRGRTRVLAVAGREVGGCYTVPQSALGANWLLPCVFAHPELNRLTYDVVVSPSHAVVPLGSLLSNVGPDIAQVKQLFARSEGVTDFPMLWGHRGAMNTLALDGSFIGYGAPRDGVRSAVLHGENAGRVMLAERPHLHSEALLAVETGVPVLGTAFWELRPWRGWHGELILLWFQSTFGWLAYLSHATSSRGDIFKLKKAQLGGIPIVDPSSIGEKSVREMYAAVRCQPFLRNPLEFGRAAGGVGPRWRIDQFFVEQLSLGIDLRSYYSLLATDPVVTTQRGALFLGQREAGDDSFRVVGEADPVDAVG